MSSKCIAVIGAGPSGLTAIKACKEEDVDVVCFERNGHPGGLWRYRDEDIDGVASVMKTTVINTNKQLSAFSDHPPPKEYPNFMHNSMMYKYFMSYAERFDLLKHIRYYKEVVKVVQLDSFDETGRWLVTTKDTKSGEISSEEFDGVMVCIGHHVYPKIPNFPGQETFTGKIIHTHSLKNCESFGGKNVVVVGIGNSAVDAAVDSTFVANKVYLSTRRGSWIFGRVGKDGTPYDFAFVRRYKLMLARFFSFDTICNEIEGELNKKFDHALYNLKPKHRVLSAHPTTNDNLPNLILSGRIVVKANIEKFSEHGVKFVGDKEETNVDVVVFATGYYIKFPFLEDNMVSTKENKIHLYKYCIPPKLKQPTLALIGLVQPLGPIFPVAEMHCRWFMQIFKGNLKLPSQEMMEKDIVLKREANAKRYVDSTRHTIQVDFVPFIDELAGQIGVKPNLAKLAFSDPKLFWTCLVEPCLPYQYRLQGPHKWEGARHALMNYKENFRTALNTRYTGEEEEKSSIICSTSSSRTFLVVTLATAVTLIWKWYPQTSTNFIESVMSICRK